MTPNIPILAWDPDGDPTVPGVLADIENMLPTRRGYAPEPYPTPSSNFALTATSAPTGGQTITYKAGSVPFVATDTKIYAFTGGTWNDVSRGTGTYAPSDALTAPWRFEAFSTPSNDRVALAVCAVNQLQAKSDMTAGVFSNVTAAPNGAATMAVQRNFVLLGSYLSGSTAVSDGWICSALEDYTDWTPDIATQCAKGRLTATPGGIVRLIAFQDYVIAFKAKSMFRGSYVGAASNTWSFPVVSRSVGLVSHDAVTEADGVLYWLGYDGFYRWDGGQVSRIASAPFEWLRSQYSYGIWWDQKIQAVYDVAQRVVRWIFLAALSTTTDKLVITYHPDTNRWGRAAMPNAGWMMTLPINTVMAVPSGSALYLADPIAYMVADGSNYVMSTPAWPPQRSSFTTGDIGADEDVLVMTRARTRFLKQPTGSTATHYWRQNLGEALTTGATVTSSDGKYDLSSAARWHRLKFEQTGMYEVSGFSIESPRAGKR